MCALLQCASLAHSVSLTLCSLSVCILLEYLFDDIIVLLDPHWSQYTRVYMRYACVLVCECLLCVSFSLSLTFFAAACVDVCVCVCVCALFVCLFVYYSEHILCVYWAYIPTAVSYNTARVCVFYFFVAFFVWFSLLPLPSLVCVCEITIGSMRTKPGTINSCSCCTAWYSLYCLLCWCAQKQTLHHSHTHIHTLAHHFVLPNVSIYKSRLWFDLIESRRSHCNCIEKNGWHTIG